MINIGLKLILIVLLFIVFSQDTKDRLVYWFLYPLTGILFYLVQARLLGHMQSLVNSLINFVFILLLITVGWIYARAIMKQKFTKTMGIGDILFFISLCFTFTPITFIILLVFSLVFSLLLHQYFKGRSEQATVPLAGYMALFFAAVYLLSFFIEPGYLFA